MSSREAKTVTEQWNNTPTLTFCHPYGLPVSVQSIRVFVLLQDMAAPNLKVFIADIYWGIAL